MQGGGDPTEPNLPLGGENYGFYAAKYSAGADAGFVPGRGFPGVNSGVVATSGNVPESAITSMKGGSGLKGEGGSSGYTLGGPVATPEILGPKAGAGLVTGYGDYGVQRAGNTFPRQFGGKRRKVTRRRRIQRGCSARTKTRLSRFRGKRSARHHHTRSKRARRITRRRRFRGGSTAVAAFDPSPVNVNTSALANPIPVDAISDCPRS